jgi:hypothetical protein
VIAAVATPEVKARSTRGPLARTSSRQVAVSVARSVICRATAWVVVDRSSRAGWATIG